MTQRKKKARTKKPEPSPPVIVPSDNATTPKADTGKAEAEDSPSKRFTGQPLTLDKWTCLATVTIAIATVFYTVAASWQLSILRDQLSQMQESTHLEHRPWVSCLNGKCLPIVPGEEIRFELLFVNSGTTPANRVKIGFEVFIGKPHYNIETYAGHRKDVAPTDIAREKTLPPNATMTAPHACRIESLTDNTLSEIKNGTLVIYAFGEVVYDDIFGQRHMTTYCSVVNPSTWKLVGYKDYNRIE